MIEEYSVIEIATALGGWVAALYYKTKSMEISWSIRKTDEGEGLTGSVDVETEKRDGDN